VLYCGYKNISCAGVSNLKLGFLGAKIALIAL
jgi:hypothetical protein